MALEHSQATKSLWTFSLVAGLVAAVLLASVGCTQSETSQQNGEASGDMHVQTQMVTIPVEGMSCAACAARVKGALKDIDGVAVVEVNLAERNVRVSTIEGRVAPGDLVVAINGLGYKASLPTPVEKEASIQYDEGNVTPESMSEAIESQGSTARNPIAKEEK